MNHREMILPQSGSQGSALTYIRQYRIGVVKKQHKRSDRVVSSQLQEQTEMSESDILFSGMPGPQLYAERSKFYACA